MYRTLTQTVLLAATCAFASASNATLLTTTFESDNGNEGAMFDVENVSGGALTLTGLFEGNFNAGDTGTVNVWYRTGTHVGNETNRVGWTLFGSSTYTSAGSDNPTSFDVGATLSLLAGDLLGFLVVTSAEDQDTNYTNGSGVYSDGALSITTGVGIDFDAAGVLAGQPSINSNSFNTPRIWNGSIDYVTAGVPEPATFGMAMLALAGLFARRRVNA